MPDTALPTEADAPQTSGGAAWRAAQVAWVVVGVAATFVLVYLCRYVLLYLFAGIIVATALRSPIGRLKKRGLSPATATAAVFLLVSGCLVGIVAVVVPTVVAQLSRLWSAGPEIYAEFRERLSTASGALPRRIAAELPEAFAPGTPAFDGIAAALSGLINPRALTSAAFAALAVGLLAFYWSLHEDRTVRSALLCLTEKRRERVREFIQTVQTKVGAFVRGQALLCLIVGLLNLAALWIIGIPFAPGLAILAGLLEALPVFGPVLGAIPALLVASTLGFDKVCWVAGAGFVIQQLEANLLLPRVMNRAVGVNALVTLLAMAAFGTLFGVLGMVLAIPCAAVIQLVINRLLLGRELLHAEAPDGRDRMSRLRFEAAELAHDIRLSYRRQAGETPAETVAETHPLEIEIESLANELEHTLTVAAESQASPSPRQPSARGKTKRADNRRAAGNRGRLSMKLVVAYALGAMLALASAALAWSIRGVVLLFALSLALAASVRPLQDTFMRRRLGRLPATALSYLVLCALFIVPTIVVSGPLSSEARRLGDIVIAATDRWQSGNGEHAAGASPLPNGTHLGSQSFSQLSETMFGVTFGVFGWFIEAVLVLALSVYWAIDREFFERLWLSLLSVKNRVRAREFWQTVEEEVGAYVRSEVLQMFAAAALLMLGYRLLGHPFPVIAALSGGALWLLPWVGVGFATAIAVALALPTALLSGTTDFLWIVVPTTIYGMAVLWWLEFIVEPRLFGRRRYNTLLMAVVTLALVEVGGFAGLLLGPPLALTLEIALSHGWIAVTTPRPAVGTARHLESLEDHVVAVTGQLSQMPNPPKELVGLADRLSMLIADASRPQSWPSSDQAG